MRVLKTAIALSLGLAAPFALAGGNLDTFKLTGEPAEDFGFPGEVAETVDIFWDERCASVEYTLDTIPPNALFPGAEIDLETTRDIIQTSLDQWTEIPTSFIELNVTQVRTIGNGPRSFDFINEVTFETAPGFTALASSPSTSLQRDAQFTPGLDIDGDGDSDVYDPAVEGINVCTDIDNDGDIEFPAGFYAAGTILDNDVQFGQTVFWETDASTTAADIRAVATHEFGHSHGLSHSLINLVSDTDGSGATMFPFIDTGDPQAELSTRDLHDDDIAWSSLSYPEGGSGPLSSIQSGDIPFDDAFSVLTGSADSLGLGIAGANIYARDTKTGEITVGTFSGETTLVSIPLFGGIFFRENIEDGVVNGSYRLPLSKGKYEVFMQSPDVAGATGANISINANVGGFYGQHGFDEEGNSNGNQEGRFERRPGAEQTVTIKPGKTPKQTDYEVNDSITLQTYGDIDFIGTGAVIGQTGVKYATRFSNAEMLIALEAGAVPTTTVFQMSVFDASQVADIDRVSLVLGRLNSDGTIAELDLNKPLKSESDFVAQDGDLSPVYFNGSNGLGKSLRNALRRDPNLDVFVVVEVPDDADVGISGIPALLALDVDEPAGNSFLALNGSDFQLTGFNWAIELKLTP